MVTRPQKNIAGQLQDAKGEITKLTAELENLSKVADDLREVQAENENLKGVLAQLKATAGSSNSTNTAQLNDMQKKVEEYAAQFKRSDEARRQAEELVNTYDQHLSTLQNQMHHLQEERDALAGSIRNVQQNANEQVTAANNRLTELNVSLRGALTERNQYAAMVNEVRSVLQGQPDVLAAVRQKVGMG